MHDFALAGIEKHFHFSDQVVSLDKSSWSECQSLSSVIRVNMLVSSANFKVQLSIPNSKSLMYIRNSSGPSTDPCGTPLKTSTQSDKTPLIPTFCFLPFSHSVIQSTILPWMPWLCIFRISGFIKGFSKVQKHNISIFPYINTTFPLYQYNQWLYRGILKD